MAVNIEKPTSHSYIEFIEQNAADDRTGIIDKDSRHNDWAELSWIMFEANASMTMDRKFYLWI